MQAWPSNIGYNLESRLSDNVGVSGNHWSQTLKKLSLAWEVRHLIVGNCRSYAEKPACCLLLGCKGLGVSPTPFYPAKALVLVFSQHCAGMSTPTLEKAHLFDASYVDRNFWGIDQEIVG